MRIRRGGLALVGGYVVAVVLLLWLGLNGVARYYDHLLRQQLTGYVQEQQVRLKWFMQAQLKNLQDELLLAAFALARLPGTRTILHGETAEGKTVRRILSAWASRSHYASLWVQMVSPDGISRYRSWTNRQGDSLLRARPDLARVLASPRPATTLSIGKYALTAKAIVPVYDGQTFLGVLEVISDLRPLIRALEREQFLAAVLVESRFAAQLTRAENLTRIDNWLLLQSTDDPSLFEALRHVDINRLAQRGVIIDFEHDLGWWWLPIQTTAQGEVGALVTTRALAQRRQELVALFEREKTLWWLVIVVLALIIPLLGVLALVLYREHGMLTRAFNAGMEWRMILKRGEAVRINRRLRRAVEAEGIDVDTFMRSPLSYLAMTPEQEQEGADPDDLRWLAAQPAQAVFVRCHLGGRPRRFVAMLTHMGGDQWLLSLLDHEALCDGSPGQMPSSPPEAHEDA